MLNGFIVFLTPITMRAITTIVRDYLSAKKTLVVKAAGMEIRGYSSDDAAKIITSLENLQRNQKDV